VAFTCLLKIESFLAPTEGTLRAPPNWRRDSPADAIAQTYMAILNQPKAAWTWEIEIRSKDERF
jgi:hypothetical protein